MTIRRTVSLTLVASLVLGTVPVMAAQRTEAQPIRASIERVVEQKEAASRSLTAAEQHELAARAHALAADPVAGQGGGGGAAKMLLISLVTAGISLGSYYLIMKKVREQQKEAEAR